MKVDRVLAARDADVRAELDFYSRDDDACRLSSAIESADRDSEREDSWSRLRADFALSASELDLLAMAVALGADSLMGRVYGYLHDDASLAYATPWLAAQLFAWPEPVAPSRDSALLRWHFAQPLDGLPNPDGIASPWSADPQAANWLMQREWRDPALGEAIALVQPDHAAAIDPLYAEQLDAMRSFVGALEGPTNGTARRLSPPVEIELIAPHGSGKRTLATELSAALGVNLLIADADELLGR